ncbi:hypothetical protein NEO20_07150, partial [Escherichia coli]|nr:hypothetical protein [Escherichia coli]MDI0556492.1 hypothetical protein [Escherichia coli]MDI0606231.1 hypothetical protein [Escherichia coli]MDI0616007.1 hypothetical protein [Escherichia coli]MDI0680434.1 hypothetical protein [Escherichia coli]
GEYLPGSLQGKISSDGCLKKEQMVVSAIASTPHSSHHHQHPGEHEFISRAHSCIRVLRIILLLSPTMLNV